MPDPLVCTRCGSDAMIPRVRVIERDEGGMRQDLEVEIQRRPNAMFFKRPERTKLSARVCSACGHAELFVDSPAAMYAAYMEADASPSVTAVEELERTREALADSQIRLGELEEKLDFVQRLLETGQPRKSLPEESQ
jgi:hypothetical protein